MYGAHVGVTEAFDWPQPETWLDVVNGRSSILFALLAGVSIAIISGGRTVMTGRDLTRARVRIVVRAALIFALGIWLEVLGTRIAIILPVYAVLFLAALPVLRLPSRWLFTLAGVFAVLMPVVVARAAPEVPGDDYLLDLLVSGSYPGLIWIVFVLVGLGVGRLALPSLAVQVRLLATGVGLAVIGYGAGVIASGQPTPRSPWVATLLTVEAHSGSPFEVVGSTGFALGVLALCLLATRVARWPLFPLAAVGSMALSAYTAHVVIISFIGDEAFEWPDNSLYLAFLIGALVACTAWAILLGRGPLERALTWISRRIADTPNKG
jgi:uncharacterized protein